MKRFKILCLVLLCLVFSLTGCNEAKVSDYIVPTEMKSFATNVVAENSNLSLSWDDDAKCVMLTNKKTGYVWATTPYDFLSQGKTSYYLSSPIILDYYNPDDNSSQIAQAFDCIENGTVSAEIKNGVIKVYFYFSDIEITIPVSYELREESLAISINSSEIVESGKVKLISISLTPYFCSIANTMDKNSYLFIPSGSGALMYTDDEVDKEARNFTGEVYGHDMACTNLDNVGDEEPIRLPVFGAANGKDGLLAIIESGDNAAYIEAASGNTSYGYSNVGASFFVRGYNNIEWESGVAFGSTVANDIRMLNDEIPKNREFLIGYYPLSNENANYNGMAECYRKYLAKNNRLEKSEKEQSPYHITLIGGTQTDGLILGFHYDKFLPLTTFSQAHSIINEFVEKNDALPSVLLKGFGKSGISVGQIAGGYGFANALGNAKTEKKFFEKCKELGVNLYTDFDIIRFSKSGDGFNTFLDSAKAANSETVYYFPLKKNIRVYDTAAESIRFLSRENITKAANKLLKKTKNEIDGIGLSTLGDISYSDYNNIEYMVKGNIREQVSEIISNFKKQNHSILLSSANEYAAGLGDEIINVPLQNGGYFSLDETIPFYEMIYGGIKPLYSEPLNISEDYQGLLLRAVECGVSPAFMLSFNVDITLINSDDFDCYGILYENNLQRICDTVSDTKEFFEKIKGVGIKSHMLIGEDVTKTVFNNGVTVYVNHSDNNTTVDDISLMPKSFQYK